MKILKSNCGFSLIQVMIAFALMSGLSLVFMRIVDNSTDSQVSMESKAELLDLKRSIGMILENDDFCRVSLAGNGPIGSPLNPVTFFKKDIDEVFSEGLDIELYYSNQSTDKRSMKKYNGANNPGSDDKSNLGKLKILSLRLVMDNPTDDPAVSKNYNDSVYHKDIGKIIAIVERKISKKKSRESRLIFDVALEMSTGQGPDKKTTILGCSNSAQKDVSISPGSIICVGKEKWLHHDWSNIKCNAPQSGYYRSIDHYLGASTVSSRFYANKGDVIEVKGEWNGWDQNNGCFKRAYVNSIEVAPHWGDNGCKKSLSNYSIIYSFDQ